MGKHVHMCKMCGKEFEDYCKTTKFCSRNCYDKHRKENGKLRDRECVVCGKLFRPSYSGQIFCSVDCRVKSTENKIDCICDHCGKHFKRIKSEVDKNTHHYCSIDCKQNAMQWNNEDVEILRCNYGKIPYKEMVSIFSTPKSIKEISRKAVSIGLATSRKWSTEEIKILIDNYSSKPMSDVLRMLPGRSQHSILGKAKSLDLKSYFYLNRVYTKEDEEYLKNNYLNKSNDELAKILNRSPNGIAQHLFVLKLYRPREKSGYNSISEYIRGRLIPWIKQVKRDNNFTCSITGTRSKIIIHHIRGFNLILDEAIEKIDFPIYDSINDYSDKQLDELFHTFYDLQELYKNYICLTESVHKQFHSIYGYGNNTEDQWCEFVNTYYKN